MPFHYDTFTNPYAGSIADLIQAPGRAQAQAALTSGQAYGNALANIGSTIGGVIQQATDPRVQLERAQLAQAQQQQGDIKALDAASQPAPGPVQPGQSPAMPSRDDILAQLPGHLRATVQKQFDEADESAARVQKARIDAADATTQYFGTLASSVRTHGYDPSAAMVALLHAQDVFKGDPQALAELGKVAQQIQANPTPQTVQSLIAPFLQQQLVKTTAGETVTDVNSGNVVAQGPPKAKTKTEIAAAAAAGDPVAQATLDKMQPVAKAPNSQESEFSLDGQTVKGDYLPGTNGAPGRYFYNGVDVTGRVKAKPAASTVISPSGQDDVKESVAGMIDGTTPPILPGRATKEYLATLAEAHRRGYNLQAAVTDWNATQKHVATMNGQQQTRLNQSINALPDLLDTVDALASKWKGGKFPVLNRANLALAKGGAFGDDVATVARQLDSQIADVTADLGNVYMGGNSPTDQALGLAAKSLSGDWSEKVLHDMVTLARGNVKIRQNSIKTSAVAGVGSDNPYATQTPAPASDPRAAASAAAAVRQPIPGHPGKFAISTDGGKTWKAE